MTVDIGPASIIIVEGIFALYLASVRQLLNLKLFVSTPDAVCFQRRLDRDTIERGRPPESVIDQYNKTVRPSAECYVLPTAEYADLIIPGDNALNLSVELTLAAIGDQSTRKVRG